MCKQEIPIFFLSVVIFRSTRTKGFQPRKLIASTKPPHSPVRWFFFVECLVATALFGSALPGTDTKKKGTPEGVPWWPASMSREREAEAGLYCAVAEVIVRSVPKSGLK